MKHELKVPTVGESIQEVQIGQWLKGEGQWAAKDENLVEIESDKATVELAAPAAGILLQVLHRQGDVVPVGALIGYLEEAPQPDGARHDVERIANPSHAPNVGVGSTRRCAAATCRRRSRPPRLVWPPSLHRASAQIAKPHATPLAVRPPCRRLHPCRPTRARVLNWCPPRTGRPHRLAPCTAPRRVRRKSCP